jgi:hypothetical protein
MRLLALSCLLAAVMIATVETGHTQSAYSYPWCARYPRDIGGFACYYTSFEQCWTRPIGGYCRRSPFYRGPDPGVASAAGRRGGHI